ncbi:MAG: 6-phospho-3-hexuloisomerase [Anaerolineaceae bacterium]|nr:6-phospho-3-hexuloisomerase [Anaerolineaceae bacterium]
MAEYRELVGQVMDELGLALTSVNPEAVTSLRQDILDARRIFVAGQGRSGLRMQAFAMRLMHLDLNAHVVGGVTTPAVNPGDLLIVGSGSGRTESLVHYARRAHDLNAQVSLITIASESPIGKYADSVIRIAAASPKLETPENERQTVQPMGSLFEQALGLLLDIVVIQLMDDLTTDQTAMFARHANLE